MNSACVVAMIHESLYHRYCNCCNGCLFLYMSITESTEECVFAVLREECETHIVLSGKYLQYWNAYYLDNDWCVFSNAC